MKVLELFAGSRSIGKVADRLAFDVYSSDIEQFGGIDYVIDILDFDVTKIPFVPDIIWASCPCTAFSVAAIGKNWTKVADDYIPKNPRAEFGLKLVQKTLEIIEHFNPTYFFIENPRGMLRKMPIMADLPRQGVTYCQYGDTRMKPTDIWTNSTKWIPRPMCKNGDPCHVAAPRGSKTGTQGLKGSYERSKIPEELCLEILKSCI
jgi:hypothetical protein